MRIPNTEVARGKTELLHNFEESESLLITAGIARKDILG